MAVEVRWYDPEQTIILWKLIGRWTWEEFYPVYDQAIALRQSVSHRTDSITDFTHTSHLPPHIITHSKAIAQRRIKYDMGMNVFITYNTLLVRMFKISLTVYPFIGRNYRIVNTEAEALALIYALRAEAASTPAPATESDGNDARQA
ncbi:MAG: hypothetical protein H7Y11_15690 [Armatimonadetes bacterium]|nr:hypothetical protein [Anaerolineae bacterium]